MTEYHVKLDYLKCLNKEEDPGTHSEIYLRCKIDGGNYFRLPAEYHSFKETDNWDINEVYTFNDQLKIELWEDDGGDNDDHLGTCIIEYPHLTNTYHFKKLKTNDSVDYDYVLGYEDTTQ